MRRHYWVLDLLVVILFASIGVDYHGFNYEIAGVARVAAPFVIALAGGVAVLQIWRDPLSVVSGMILGVVTNSAGMLMRGVLWSEGTPQMFILISASWFVGVMGGWRLIAQLIGRRRVSI